MATAWRIQIREASLGFVEHSQNITFLSLKLDPSLNAGHSFSYLQKTGFALLSTMPYKSEILR